MIAVPWFHCMRGSKRQITHNLSPYSTQYDLCNSGPEFKQLPGGGDLKPRIQNWCTAINVYYEHCKDYHLPLCRDNYLYFELNGITISRDSSVSKVSDSNGGRPAFDKEQGQGQIVSASCPAGTEGSSFPGIKGRSVKVITHLQLARDQDRVEFMFAPTNVFTGRWLGTITTFPLISLHIINIWIGIQYSDWLRGGRPSSDSR
jgi:hypothetical protein